TGTRFFGALDFSVDVEEELVFNQRAAHRAAALIVAEVRIRDDLRAGHRVALKRVVATKGVERSVKHIRATLGDGVDVRSGESAFTHVERRNGELKLRDGIIWNRLRVCLSSRRGIIESEWI